MTNGIERKYRRSIIESLSANRNVERVVFFGSRVFGTFAPTSDINLALFRDERTWSD
jgi:predicted nucleotidyltransferase